MNQMIEILILPDFGRVYLMAGDCFSI